MRFDTVISDAARTVRTEMTLCFQYGMRVVAPAIGLWWGLLFIALPVLAQGNNSSAPGSVAEKIPKTLVCSGAGKLISAVFGLLVLALVIYGVYYGINGWRKIGSPNPEKKKKGREEIKGAGIMFFGALLSTGLPNALTALGLSVFKCIDISPI